MILFILTISHNLDHNQKRMQSGGYFIILGNNDLFTWQCLKNKNENFKNHYNTEKRKSSMKC